MLACAGHTLQPASCLTLMPPCAFPAHAGLDSYVALMQRCWAHDPLVRPAFQEVIQELK